MARITSIKKSKTAAPKAAKDPEAAAAATHTAESSSKPSKTLKRKKDAEPEAIVAEEAEAPKSSKKLKKDTKSAKVSKNVEVAVEDLVEAVVLEKNAEKKKKAKTSSETAPTPSTKTAAVEIEDKPKKSKSKSKDAPAADATEPTAPVSILKKSKDSDKKSKPTQPAPTSISRPRKPKAATTSKSKKSKAKSPEPVDEDEDAEDTEKSEDASDEEGHLHGFSTDDDDSSDEEDAMNVEPSEFDLAKLPTIAKDDATVKRKLEKAKQNPTEDRGVLFLSRLPHGFYEEQLKAYFSQFGNVTRLRISRNKKTGKSKHYGFIEFDSSSVAQIVADTMDNYLLMGHIMRCKVIPKAEVHPELWVGANRKWRVVPKDRVARVEHNKPRTDAEQMKAAKRLLKRQQERKSKLAKAGIEYDFDSAAYKTPTSAPIQV